VTYIIRKTQRADILSLLDVERSASQLFKSVPQYAWIADMLLLSRHSKLFLGMRPIMKGLDLKLLGLQICRNTFSLSLKMKRQQDLKETKDARCGKSEIARSLSERYPIRMRGA